MGTPGQGRLLTAHGVDDESLLVGPQYGLQRANLGESGGLPTGDGRPTEPTWRSHLVRPFLDLQTVDSDGPSTAADARRDDWSICKRTICSVHQIR